MKGEAPSQPWPAPAAPKTTLRAKSTPISRTTLALLDEYTAQQSRRGYDPYNTQESRGMSDVWVRKPKRD